MNKGVTRKMNLNHWYDRGLEKDDYIALLDKHRDAFMHIYKHFTVPEKNILSFQGKGSVRALVLAAEWCGHCMLDIPIFLHLSEATNIPVRFLVRDENLELMDQYLTNDKRYVPIIIFIDEAGNEICKWGPMAPEIANYIDEIKRKLPAQQAPEYEQAFRDFINEVGKEFKQNSTLWNYVYEDMNKVLSSV